MKKYQRHLSQNENAKIILDQYLNKTICFIDQLCYKNVTKEEQKEQIIQVIGRKMSKPKIQPSSESYQTTKATTQIFENLKDLTAILKYKSDTNSAYY